MEVRSFAEAVLLATDLEEKLFSPPSLTDEHPGDPIAALHSPGRSQHLPLVSSRPIPPTPKPRQLMDESVRGAALHTFAHHELQALELMALALLRFPDAPQGFRLGLAHIMRDEQRHFRLYQARAEHWGVGLGEVGASHFFWDTVSTIEDPLSFLAALSLTYEQANLDFAVYWKDAFAAIDDGDTVRVLQTVYEDEIRHVRHGVEWFRRLGGGDDFDSYKRALVFPLTPGRGKGPIFNRAGREAAGFSPAFMDEMQLSNVSRGRPPRVFSFDPFVESQIAGLPVKGRVRDLVTDLGSLMMFLGHREDVVVAPRPSLPVLRRLHEAGFEIPQFVAEPAAVGERVIAGHRPWGWSPVVARRLGQTWDPALGVLSDKTWAFAQRQAFAEACDARLVARVEGQICTDVSAVEARLAGGGEWIAKAPFSTSGQHRLRLAGSLDKQARGWLDRHLAAGPVLVEPWYRRLLDLSVQIEIEAERIVPVGISRFSTAGTGAYRGAVMGKWNHGLSSELNRCLHQAGARNLLEAAANQVGRAAQSLGYAGPLGVDAMVVQTDEGVRLLPILEVNPRFTMGRVALSLQRRCSGFGGWFFVAPGRVLDAGFADLDAFVQAVHAQPVVADERGLHSGILFTTDPAASRSVLTLLCVGRTQIDAVQQWRQLGFDWPL
jgi:uncharacterized ferritin-like protein (DUF455 family)